MRLAEGAGRQPVSASPAAPYARVGSTTRAACHEEQVDEVGDGEGRLGAQRAGDEEPERGEGGGAEHDREHQAAT